VAPYRDAPIRLVKRNDPDEWIKTIIHAMENPKQLKIEGQRLREWVLQEHMMPNRRRRWMNGMGIRSD